MHVLRMQVRLSYGSERKDKRDFLPAIMTVPRVDSPSAAHKKTLMKLSEKKGNM